jgi:hypothetical protein
LFADFCLTRRAAFPKNKRAVPIFNLTLDLFLLMLRQLRIDVVEF